MQFCIYVWVWHPGRLGAGSQLAREGACVWARLRGRGEAQLYHNSLSFLKLIRANNLFKN